MTTVIEESRLMRADSIDQCFFLIILEKGGVFLRH